MRTWVSTYLPSALPLPVQSAPAPEPPPQPQAEDGARVDDVGAAPGNSTTTTTTASAAGENVIGPQEHHTHERQVLRP